MQVSYLILCAFLYFPLEISGHRILAMFSCPGKSDWDYYQPYLLGLAEKGNNVTVVGYHPRRFRRPGYNVISLAGRLDSNENSLNIQDIIGSYKYNFIPLVWQSPGYQTCEDLYNTKEIRDLANSTAKYDLLITDLYGGDCFHPFAYKFKIPLIGITSGTVPPFSADLINLPDNPSYIPNSVIPFGSNMNFLHRIINTVTLMTSKFGYHYATRRRTERLARKLFPDMPPLLKISKRISLIIANTHFSINGAKPKVPALVEAAGMHINPLGKILPAKLEHVLNASMNGAVYFSFGSIVKSETLPPEILETFISVFRSLNITVIWKIDASVIDDLPFNVLPVSGVPQVPQVAVLCHPNVKVFITLGDILSSQEAVYCGVPMLGIPIFGDQHQNMRNLEAQGCARHLNVKSITETSLRYTLTEILENPEYKLKAKRISELFQVRLFDPIEEAIYWTEYVITQQGARYLQTSARSLNWYEYLLLDVVGSVVFGFIFSVAAVFVSIKLMSMDRNQPQPQPLVIEPLRVPLKKPKVKKPTTYFT